MQDIELLDQLEEVGYLYDKVLEKIILDNNEEIDAYVNNGGSIYDVKNKKFIHNLCINDESLEKLLKIITVWK